MTDDDIEADLAAGAAELLCDPTFAFRRAREVGRNVDYRDEAVRVGGDCVNLGHGISPACLAEEIDRWPWDARPTEEPFGVCPVPRGVPTTGCGPSCCGVKYN